MKKLVLSLLIICLCVPFAACQSNDQQSTPTKKPSSVATQPSTPTKPTPTQPAPTISTTPAPTQPAPTTPATPEPTQPAQPTKIELTTENISDYLIFTCKTGTVIKESKPLGNELGKCTISLTTSPKKRGDFDELTLTVVFKTKSEDWSNQQRTIQIPFDGKSENSYNISSRMLDFISSYPGYTCSIESVTGYFIPA